MRCESFAYLRPYLQVLCRSLCHGSHGAGLFDAVIGAAAESIGADLITLKKTLSHDSRPGICVLTEDKKRRWKPPRRDPPKCNIAYIFAYNLGITFEVIPKSVSVCCFCFPLRAGCRWRFVNEFNGFSRVTTADPVDGHPGKAKDSIDKFTPDSTPVPVPLLPTSKHFVSSTLRRRESHGPWPESGLPPRHPAPLCFCLCFVPVFCLS